MTKRREHISMLDLLGMKLRKVNAEVIVQSRIRALRAGVEGRSGGDGIARAWPAGGCPT